VPGISNADAVAAGDQHSCAATASGVTCWGANDSYQLGNTGALVQGPVAVAGVGVPQSIAAGFDHTCAVDPSGVRCWGAGQNGQLGNGSFPAKSTPVTANTSSGVSVVIAGSFHSCSISSQLQCWGADTYGQLGDGNSGTGHDAASPLGVSISNPVAVVAAGASHSCAASQRDGLECWGSDSSGQLGLGPTPPTDTTKPLQVGLTDVQKLALGADHSCAIVADGRTYCWGRNTRGQTATAPPGVAVMQPTPILDR
jgi:alpha-tubulin suppressor-like RCC1 family protein